MIPSDYALMLHRQALLVPFVVLFHTTPARAQSHASTQPSTAPIPAVEERVEVIATRIPEPPHEVPAPVEVFLASELFDRGAHDLRSALALATGVDMSPGGDNGPASSVPEFWGLKEFDAFLLVVDGVPWGGAFNPDLATVSLDDVERIEVMRGPAPVTYGATSFVGVIHVVHKTAGTTGTSASVRGGSFGSGAANLMMPLPLGSLDSRISVDVERRAYKDDRTSFRRGHVSWRNNVPWQSGKFWFVTDLTWLDQDPASPHPRVGQTLSSDVPLDANHNPAGAFLDSTRAVFVAGIERKVGAADWSTTGSFSRAAQDQFRGFLVAPVDVPHNAIGLRETIDLTDVYVDSHFAWTLTPRLRAIAGGDYLFGEGTAHGETFEYDAPLDGAFAPAVVEPADLPIRIEDRRQFLGIYSMVEWQPAARLRIDAGLRLNVTDELREAGEWEEMSSVEPANDTHVRPSGSVGAVFTAWSSGHDFVRPYTNYRDTFKPAAFDFGLGEAEGEGGEEEELLQPEAARSVEGGLKSRWLDGRLSADVSAFHMDFENLVIAQAINGLPALTNAGTERFRGIESAVAMSFAPNVTTRATYSFHDATFRHYLTEFDGVPTELGGKRLEMSARHLASAGVIVAPTRGVIAGAELQYVGSRYLNKRNTALADGYATLGLTGGYRFGRWELRVNARNVTDERPPVVESELGDAQYYRLPARHIDLVLTRRF